MIRYLAIRLVFMSALSMFLLLNAQTEIDSPDSGPSDNLARARRSKELGNMALSDGIFILAEEDYRQYLKESEAAGDLPSVADALLRLVETYCAWNKPFEARREYENFLNRARPLFQGDKSLSDRALFWEACVLASEKDYSGAVEILEKLRNSVPPDDRLQLDILDRLGLALVRQGKWEEAEKIYSLLADGAGVPGAASNDAARSARNICAFMKGDLKNLKKIAEAKDESPLPMSSRIARMLIMTREKRLKEACAFFNEQKNVVPSESRNLWYFAVMELAERLKEAGMNAEAALMFENARIFSAGLGKSEAEKSSLALIEAYSELKDWEKTVENCEYFKRNFPDSADIFGILLKLARLYSEKFDVKNVRNMKDNYFALINHEFADPAARSAVVLEAAEKLLDAKNYAEAEALVREHLGKFPQDSENSANARLLLVQAVYYEGRPQEAVDMLSELLKNEKLDGTVRRKAQYLLALATYRMKNYHATKKIIMPILKEFPERDELGIELGIILADCENELGNHKEAIRLYSNYAIQYPENPRAPELIDKAARISMDMGNFSEAEKYFDKIIADYPGSGFYEMALYNKTQALIFSGESEKLERDSATILRNLKGNELFFSTLLALTDYYSETGSPNKAIALIDDALASSEKTPSNADLTAVPADVASKTNGGASAGKIGKSREREWLSRLVYEKAMILHRFGRSDEALESLSNLFDVFKDSPFLAEAYFLQGDILSSNNDFEKALSAYKESAKMRPESKVGDSALARAAECLFTLRTEKGRLEEATAINRKLLAKPELDPNFREHVQYNLAKCEEEAGNKEAALLLYHRIITEHKNDYLKEGRLRNHVWLVRAANSAAKIYKEKGTPNSYEVARQIYKDLANVLKVEPVEAFKKEIKRLDEILAPK